MVDIVRVKAPANPVIVQIIFILRPGAGYVGALLEVPVVDIQFELEFAAYDIGERPGQLAQSVAVKIGYRGIYL